MLKYSSTLALSVTTNLSIKLELVSINGPRETYFVDAPRLFLILKGYGKPHFANINKKTP